jgi:hypothetical protein
MRLTGPNLDVVRWDSRNYGCLRRSQLRAFRTYSDFDAYRICSDPLPTFTFGAAV